ncbi:endolytic transglycosylase MltG [Nocardioides coralli]|uniref:endolytic transglycosylase MltG n=1 Tax=Nocardioides coralli TaxID=2872154 RepID=UPI001CA3BA63|nr:endolytic transglycosylase MltG [Nocardioides coralli]QZY30499.1 endolytic transglycosylase MltG [Nocardioides coralli]
MSDNDPLLTESGEELIPPEGGARRRRRRRLPGCVAALVALAVLVVLFYVGVTKGVELVRDQFADPADYPGPGQGKVVYTVEEGDTVADMGRGLKSAGVVASVQAFLNAASAEPGASSIQVGAYQFQKEMPAADALDVLLDPANILKNTVTIPEGLRVEDIVAILAKETDFNRARFERVLDDPRALGLPDYADGNPEGYLFPSTYDFGPKAKPQEMLAAMVDRWEQAASEANLEAAAERLGYTPHELMTVASLIEAEAARQEDRGKVARVIYNRLEGEETNGLLQIDATVNYATENDLGAVPTTEDLEVDSPYNTYQNPGLPPGPIEAPGDAAIQAAANPTDGGWFYYVTVNLRTGETKFAESYDEFLTYKNELREYCENESQGAC